MNLFRRRRVYADAAAATPMSPQARRELLRLLPLAGNPSALHQEGVAAARELAAARQTIARAIGAHADEIVFTASGTEANNLALMGALRPLMRSACEHQMFTNTENKKIKVHAITTTIEHASVLEPLRVLARNGLRVTEVGVSREGILDLDAFAEAIRPETALVSVQLVNSEVGAIEPLREVAKAIRKQGRTLLFHTDASQAPLWLPLNVEKLGVDLMTLDAQKVLGPKGIGCLYVRRGVELEPIVWGGKQEGGLRAGTENLPLAGAFAVALAEARRGAPRRAARTAAARDYLWREIKRLIPDAILNGPSLGPERVANSLNISIPGLEAQMAVVALDALGIAVSTRSACSAGDPEPSHVIAALGLPEELAGTAIRITLLPSATRAECRRIAAALAEAARRYRTPGPFHLP